MTNEMNEQLFGGMAKRLITTYFVLCSCRYSLVRIVKEDEMGNIVAFVRPWNHFLNEIYALGSVNETNNVPASSLNGSARHLRQVSILWHQWCPVMKVSLTE